MLTYLLSLYVYTYTARAELHYRMNAENKPTAGRDGSQRKYIPTSDGCTVFTPNNTTASQIQEETQ